MKLTSPDGRADRLDAAVWTLLPALILTVVGVGAVNGDAIRHANSFAEGTWRLNPNHLLMEPLAAAWFDLATALEWGDTGVDRLKLLSYWTGGAALGLFRWLVAPAVTTRRTQKNVSTAVLAGLQAFIVYWISGEPILLQVPVLVLVGFAVVRFLKGPNGTRATWVGAGFGLAALLFVSNAVVGAATVVALFGWGWLREERRFALGHLGYAAAGAVGIGLTGMVTGWLASSPGTGLWGWLTSYAGEVPLSEHVFGISTFDLGGLATSMARTVYGSTIALVDVAPSVAAVRGETPWGLVPILAPLVALVAAGTLCGMLYRLWSEGARSRELAVAVTGWLVGVAAFGVVYNNSDSQYFIQIAVPAAIVVASAPTSASGRGAGMIAFLALLGCVGWNLGQAYATQISYPRSERMAMLQGEVSGGSLVVYPGSDTTNRLLHLLPDTLYRQRLSLMSWADEQLSQDGLHALADSLRSVLAQGGDVRVVSVYGAPTVGQPWAVLTRRGYAPDRITGLFTDCTVAVKDSTGRGFGTRSVTGDAACVGRSPEAH